MALRALGKKNTGSKFGDNKFIMMQFGKQFLNEKDGKLGTRIVPSTTNDQWQWCVREKVGSEYKVTYWFGVKLGSELLLRAILKGIALNTLFFEKNGEYIGNARVNVKDVATKEELDWAKQAAEDEAWEDWDDEEEEEEAPVVKTKAKASGKRTATPAYAEAIDAEETEDELPY